MRLLLASLIAIGVLSACATPIMSEKECVAGDWYSAGLEDGAKGLLETAFDERAEACTQFDVAADLGAYQSARATALDVLCTAEGGYRFGRDGNQYLGVCGTGQPRDGNYCNDPLCTREYGFVEAYSAGRKVYAAQLARDSAQSNYDSALATIDRERGILARARDIYEHPATLGEDRDQARRDMDDARRRLGQARQDRDDWLYALGREDEALAQAEASSQGWRQQSRGYFVSSTLSDAHDFARAEDAIDFCTDELETGAPVCLFRAGGAIRDRKTGAACAVGPGEARHIRLHPWTPGHMGLGSSHLFSFHDGEEGRFSRQPAAFFWVISRGEEYHFYDGVSCGQAYPEDDATQ